MWRHEMVCKVCKNKWKPRYADISVVNTKEDYCINVRCPRCGHIEKKRK